MRTPTPFQLRQFSIRGRLAFLVGSTTCLAFLLFISAFLAYQRSALRQDLVRSLQTQAAVASHAVSADLDFGATFGGTKSLGDLATNAHILAVRVYDQAGHPFATHLAAGHAEPLPASAPTLRDPQFLSGMVELVLPVTQDGVFKGTLLIRSDTLDIQARFWGSALLMTLVSLVLVALVLAGASWLQKPISEPILALAGLALEVSQKGHVDRRLDITEGGELGTLGRAFNDMLRQLQERNEQSRALIENMFSGFLLMEVLLDEQGQPVDHRLIQANSEFDRVLGLKRSEELGRTSAELGFKWPAEVAQAYYAVAMGGEPIRWERFNESLQRHFEARVYSPRKGQFAMIFDDITARKHHEEKLALAHFQADQALDLTHAGYWHVPLDGSGWYDSSERTVLVFGDPPREGYRYRIMEDWFVNVEAGDQAASERALENYLAAVDGRVPEFNSVYAYKRPADGRVVWVHALGRLVRNAQGLPTDLYGVVRDITEERFAQQALRASEEETRSLAESMPQIVWATRADGWNTYFNQQWVDYTGLTMEESHGHGWITPFHPDDRQRAWDAWQDATRHGATYALECRLRRADGTYRWWLIRGVPLLDEHKTILKWFGTCTDIDDIKHNQEELHRLNEHLEGLVEERTGALRQALEAAEAANRAKSSFLASMSHELRTPLNAVLGFAQLMSREPERSPRDLAKLEKILRAGEHLLGLINDVLSIARIESHKLVLNPAPFDLRACIQGIEEMVRLKAESKFLELSVALDEDLPGAVEGDEGKLRQVLLNLLGNAVKFTERGRVRLEVSCRKGGPIRFEISDTGPGIAPGEMPGLFESFVQTEAGRRSAEGSGLGLNLSQALVRLMGGEIRVESEVGRGSTFSFDLSLEATAALPGKASGWKPLLLAEGQPALRQLVVDDKASNRDLLTDYMEAIGFPVQSVSNGQEAVEAWRTWQPRVIWMDMRMPVLDGYEATRRIRALEQESGQPRTTIIAITASIFSEDRGGVFSAGCDGIIHKPFREQELFEALAQFAGVVFQERVPEAPAPGREPGPPDLGGLDPVWRQAFYEALRAGDMQEARILASRLPPSQESLSTYLKQALHAFRLDELERLFSTPEAP